VSLGARRGRGPCGAAGGGAARTSTRPISMRIGVCSTSPSFAAAVARACSVASCAAPTGASVAPADADAGRVAAVAGAALTVVARTVAARVGAATLAVLTVVAWTAAARSLEAPGAATVRELD